MNVLVACEFSGIVRDAFLQQGHNAVSWDLVDSERPGPHVKGDIKYADFTQFDLMIAHPPCQFLCSSGLHWNKRRPRRADETERSLDFVRFLLSRPVPRIALENPKGAIGSRIRPADQYIQPYQFGHDASKATGLWLVDLPKLQPTGFVEPRIVGGRPRWGNQTDSGQNKLGPSETRSSDRSRTYEGIAHAMAVQWGALM